MEGATVIAVGTVEFACCDRPRGGDRVCAAQGDLRRESAEFVTTALGLIPSCPAEAGSGYA